MNLSTLLNDEQKPGNRALRYSVFAAVLLIKLLLCDFWFTHWNGLNPDESRNYELAWNYLHGKGYAVNDVTTGFRFKESAFHGSATVFLS